MKNCPNFSRRPSIPALFANSIAIAAALLLPLIPHSAHAASETWVGGGGTNWSTGGWSTVAPVNGDSIFFGTVLSGSSTTLNNDISSLSLAGITFNAGASAWTLNGSALTLTGAIANNGSNLETINTAITLSGTQAINANTGNITLGGILSGVGSGITANGAGTVVLGGVNTYSGGTTINAGVVQLTQTSGAAALGAFTLGGGNFQINQAGSNFSYAPTINLTADSTFSDIGAGQINYSGALTGNGHALNVSTVSAPLYINGTVAGVTQFNVLAGAMGLDLGAGNRGGGVLVNVSNGATLDLFTAGTLANNITLNGGTGLGGNGALNLQRAITLSGTLTMSSGTSTLNMTGNNTTVSGPLSGLGSLTLSNSGSASTFALTGSNSGFTGTLTANSNSAIDFQSANAGSANAAWVFNDTNANRVRIDIAGGGTVNFGSLSGNGQMQNDTSATTTTISVGALGTDTTFGGTVNNNGTGILALAKVGAGSLTLSGANGYSGGTTINGGALVLANASALNTSSGGISFGGGTLRYGSGITTDYSSRIAAGTSGSAVTIDTGSNNVTFATALTSSQSGGLTKSGSGTLTLSANNAYTGVTTVNGGALSITGTLNSTGGVTVNAGATLLGNGLVNGTTTVSAGGALTNGNGGVGNTGALTLGALTFSTGSALNLNKANDTSTVALAITGTLTTASGITLKIPTAPNWTNGGTYNLISYGAFSGANSNFTLGAITGLGARQSATIGNTGSGSGFITLAISGDTPFWTGAENSNWTLTAGTGAKNWQLVTQGTATDFLNNDQVLFDDNASGSTNVNISSADVHVAAVVFNNNAKDYTISSTGGFVITDGTGGSVGALSKSGTGKATLTTINTYTGVTSINAGTLQLGDGTTNGDVATSSGIVNNGQLNLNRSSGSSFTYSNAISGTGNVTLSGLGTQILTGANSYSGGTTINSGTLQIGNGGTAGSLSTTGTITNNSSLVFNRSNAISQSTDFGIISGVGSVKQSGSGTLTLTGANSYSGGTTISSGTVIESNNNALGAGAVTLNGGALNNSGGATTVANNIIVGSGGGTIALGSGAGDLTLSGTLSGAGNLTLGISTLNSINFNFAGNTMTSGTITTAATGDNQTVFRFNNTAATSSVVDWVFNGAGNRANFLGTSGTYQFGSLAGSGILWDNFLGGQSIVLSIGGNNHDATFGGTIRTNGATVSVIKSGIGAETFTGANTYNGGTTLSAGTLIVGNNNALGTGTATLNGGTLKAGGAFTLANNIAVSSSSVIDLAANNTTFNGNFSGSGALNFTNSGGTSTATLSGSNAGYGGTVTINNNNAVNFTSANAGSASAAWVFNDGNADRVRINIAGGGTINFGSLSGNGKIQNDTSATTSTISAGALGTDTTFGGTLKNNGTGILALTKVGAGNLTLTGSNGYTGATNVVSGTLALGVGGSINGSTSLTVASGATFDVTAVGGFTVGAGSTLSGAGTVNGAVTVAATGTLNASTSNLTTGALSLSGTSTFALSLNTALGTTSKVTASSLSLTDIGNTAVLTITDTGFDTALAIGTKFAFLDYTGSGPGNNFSYTGIVNGSTGTFVLSSGDQITLGSNIYTINYADTDNSFNAVSLTTAAVPEPGTWAMLVGGMGMLLGFQKCRRSKSTR